jgi:iron complex outermembrane receptor protein
MGARRATLRVLTLMLPAFATAYGAEDSPKEASELLPTIPVAAPEPTPPAVVKTEAAVAPKIEEIVVTAERRAESLQDVPVAVTAFNADQLERAGVVSTENLSQVTPGLRVTNTTGSATVFLRGVGSINVSAGNEASVAFYADDVYFAETSGLLTNLDNIERIEVLKGPQGTLYGRNATGGLIHIITPEPQADPSVRAKVSFEDYDAVVGSLYVTGPLFSDDLKLSLSAAGRRQGEGYGRNVFLGTEIGFSRYENVRAKLLWEATDADSVTVAASYYRDISDEGVVGPVRPGTTTLTLGRYTGDPRNVSTNFDVGRLTLTKDTSVAWEHRFGDALTLKSVSAYRDVDFELSDYDLDSSSVNSALVNFSKYQHSLQQEFLLQGVSDLASGWLLEPLNYTAGLFYFNARSRFPAEIFAVPDISSPLGISINRNARNEVRSYSGFGQIDARITERDTLIVGLRYTLDRQSIVASGDAAGIPTGGSQAEKDFGETTWRVAVKHEFTGDLMMYAGVSRGFKGGLFNGGASPATPQSVRPELLDAYDLGVKGTFLGGAFQANLNAYYYDYQDLQVVTLQPTSNDIRNAASARVYGVELESQAALPVPVGELLLLVNAQTLKSKYVKFPSCQVGTTDPLTGLTFLNGEGDCSGNRLVFAPDYDLSLGMNYMLPISATGGSMGLSANYYHSDGFFYDADNHVSQPRYGTVNAEISYQSWGDRVKLRFYGRNIGDTTVRAICTRTLIESSCRATAPRTIGVGIEYRWDS